LAQRHAVKMCLHIFTSKRRSEIRWIADEVMSFQL
jgi:hypothetical protein